MNILITGAEGFVGSHLTKKLADGNIVYPLYHDKVRGPGVRGDVTDYARMLEIIVNCEIDQIYHLAARSIVRNCINDPLGCFKVNVLGTATVLEAARQSCRVSGIMVSESDKAYGPGPIPYHEDQALQPQAVYEASKACVSHIMSAYYHNYGLPVFSIRCANIYGPADSNMTRLIPRTITRILNGNLPQITKGAEEYLREFIYIDDACYCMIELMGKQAWGEVINVGSGKLYSIVGLAECVAELIDPSKPQTMLIPEWDKPKALREIPQQSLCLDKLHSLLPDFKPTPLLDGLRKTIDAYREEQNKGVGSCLK